MRRSPRRDTVTNMHQTFESVSATARGGEPRDGYATLLDPLLARLRARRVMPFVRKGDALLDIGCGRGELLFALSGMLERGVGIDGRASDETRRNIRLQRHTIDRTLPFPDGSFDTVVMLAVLEHLHHPDAVLGDIQRVLRPRGGIVMTVPTVYARPVLEFFAFRLGLVSREGVEDHKRYYTKAALAADLERAGFAVERIRYFEFGFNLFAVARKPA